jgi:hypothetical protein
MRPEEIAAQTAALARDRRIEPRDQLRALELYARLTGQLDKARGAHDAPSLISDEEAVRRINALLTRNGLAIVDASKSLAEKIE